MKNDRLEVGDLVRLQNSNDPDRQIGIIVGISPRTAHVASHGRTHILQVYWPMIQETDWEYDFFLEKLDKDNLTKDK